MGNIGIICEYNPLHGGHARHIQAAKRVSGADTLICIMSGAFVQLCLEACIPCMTTEQGVATYPNMDEADYKVSFITVPAGYELPTDNYYFEKDSYELTLVLKAVA